MKLPVGVIIKSIVDERRIKVAELMEKMGLSRQSIYYSYAKREMSEGELSRWAAALGVNLAYINERWANAITDNDQQNPNEESDYLQQHLAGLEEQFKRLLNQIEVKDKQIEGLQKTVDVLLGKSEDVAILMTTLGKALAKPVKVASATA